MERIRNKTVKVSPRSITVKGENGKTCAVVRNVCKFKDMQTSKQMEFFKIVRACGVWGDPDLMENVIFQNGKMYFLHDLRPIEFYEKVFANAPAGWESETRRYNERKAAAENMANHCTVIPCYIEK